MNPTNDLNNPNSVGGGVPVAPSASGVSTTPAQEPVVPQAADAPASPAPLTDPTLPAVPVQSETTTVVEETSPVVGAEGMVPDTNSTSVVTPVTTSVPGENSGTAGQ